MAEEAEMVGIAEVRERVMMFAELLAILQNIRTFSHFFAFCIMPVAGFPKSKLL